MNTGYYLRKLSNIQWLWAMAIGTLIVRLFMIPYAQQVDSDGVSRILTSMEWARHPYWMLTNVWAPFHYYINGLMLMLWNNPEYSPALLHVIISVGLLFPFYFFTSREFNTNGALAATFLLVISPVLFRNSFLVLAEIPGLFFILMAMNWLSKGFNENKTIDFFIAGFFMTIAAGFRYEAWLLAFLFGLAILTRKRWKQGAVFGLSAAIFPLIWMIQNHYATGDAFYSISANSRWTLEVMNINQNPGISGYLRRVWFFPFSWLIALGPPVAWLVLNNLLLTPRKTRWRSSQSIWVVIFWIFFVVMLLNAVAGRLLLHHRFTGTLVILSLPFIADFFQEFKPIRIRQLFIFGGLTIAFSFIYNIGGVSPLPRLKDQKVVKLAEIVRENIQPGELCIIDFIGWQNTWFIGLKVASETQNLLMIDGNVASAQHTRYLLEREPALILVKAGSSLDAFLCGNAIDNKQDTVFVDAEKNLVLLRYSPGIL